jgi:hypothetical protein
MATTTRPTTAQTRTMQGIAVPAESVRPQEFFAKTRRHIRAERTFAYTGQAQETVSLLKADILAGIWVRFVGTLGVVNGAGTTASTRQWPYNLIEREMFSANGASNLHNVSGLFLKARDICKKADLTDRGVTQTVGAATVSHGTLSQASESWGVGSGEADIADGNYDVELEWFLPVAEDERDLQGAIFLQTSTADLTLQLRFSDLTELFTVAGGAAVTLTGNFTVSTTKFSIPVSEGSIVVPDLSLFHSLIQSRATDVSLGENEHRIVGQGAGKALLRAMFQVWNNGAPLPMDAASFGRLAWRYGNNETPDEFLDGGHMRHDSERRYNTDIGGVWGIGVHEFASENEFRDVVDMGTTSELRLVTTVQNGIVLVSPALEYVLETVYQAGQAA